MSDEHKHEHEHEGACGCDSCDEMEDIKTEEEDVVGKEINITADGGIKKKILAVGSGWNKPPKEAEVTVHYVGTLQSDGSKFDSSRDRSEPFTFKLGVGQVIKGWDQGVATMKKGEKALLTCTAPYAYGEAGSPPKIPGGATLNFEVELLSWVDEKDISEKKDGSLMKKTLKDGEGWEQPSDDSTVTVNYVARVVDGAEFEKVEALTFAVNEEQAPTPALDRIVQNLKKGETAQVTCAPAVAYGAKGCPEKGVPANAAIVYEITLVDYKKPKMVYEMNAQELLDGAEQKRLEGNALYKEGKLARALRRYKKAIEFLDSEYKLSDEEKKKAKAAKVPCLLNVAAVKIATKEWKEAAEQCGKALDIDSKNVRALVRRGKALAALDDWDSAERDFTHALEIEPANADAQRESKELARKRSEADKKIKSRLQGMFSRMAKLEEEEAKAAAAEAELLAQQRKKEQEELEAKKKAEEEEKKKTEEKKTEEKKAEPAPASADAEMKPSQ